MKPSSENIVQENNYHSMKHFSKVNVEDNKNMNNEKQEVEIWYLVNSQNQIEDCYATENEAKEFFNSLSEAEKINLRITNVEPTN